MGRQIWQEPRPSFICISRPTVFMLWAVTLSRGVKMRILALLSLSLVFKVSAEDHPVVETFDGKIRGLSFISRSGRPFFSFLGIPFAKPPVGILRFMPPQEVEPWSEIKNATDEGPFCVQCNLFDIDPVVVGEEDCLYLSIFTPDINGSLPVMVHIHGGGYLTSDKTATGPQYIMDENVVVVDINYRLGPMGFLSFEDSIMPGNQGLKDQNLGIRWVVKNIAKFGGDPSRVTLVGESVGGGSVMHHMVSTMSKGLFQRAVTESGSIYSTTNLLPPGVGKRRAKKLANLLSCPYNNTNEAVLCLQQKNAKDLLNHMKNFRIWQVDPLVLFQPVLEPKMPGAFITGPIASFEPNPIPLLIGTTSAEGLQRTKYFLDYNMDFKWYNDHFDEVAPLSLRYLDTASNPKMVTKAIKQFYFNNREITEADWVNITNAYTDAHFITGVINAANKHPGDVYFYYFDYVGEYTRSGIDKNHTFGAAHVDEVIYLWYHRNYYPLKGKDLELSKKIVKIWTDFVKHGSVMLPETNGTWKKWTADVQNYLHISNNGFKMKTGLNEDRYKFWSSINFRDKYE